MDDLSSDLLIQIFTYLNPREIFAIACVSTAFNQVTKDNNVWSATVDRIWQDKVYIPEISKTYKMKNLMQLAYLSSINESRRSFITAKELNEFFWSFRFKESSGYSNLHTPNEFIQLTSV